MICGKEEQSKISINFFNFHNYPLRKLTGAFVFSVSGSYHLIFMPLMFYNYATILQLLKISLTRVLAGKTFSGH